MHIALHIGNSGIMAAVKQGRHIRTASYSSHATDRGAQLARILHTLLQGQAASYCIVSSVCPEKTAQLQDIAAGFTKEKPVAAEINSAFAIDYSKYSTGHLGIDRAICCESALQALAEPAPLLVIDCGTATTVNAVSENKEYLGGMILPGVKTGLTALAKSTSLLPVPGLDSAPPLFGLSTEECLLSGALHGNGILLEGIIHKVWENIGKTGYIYLTGGNAPRLLPYLHSTAIHKEHLLLEGLFLLLNRQLTQKSQKGEPPYE